MHVYRGEGPHFQTGCDRPGADVVVIFTVWVGFTANENINREMTTWNRWVEDSWEQGDMMKTVIVTVFLDYVLSHYAFQCY